MNRRISSVSFMRSAIRIVVILGLLVGAASAAAQEITGTSTIGPRTSHIFTLRIPPDPAVPDDYGDTLPPGSAIYYQFGIFDTGANTVGINNVDLTLADGTTIDGTANFLDLCGSGDTYCGTPTGTPPRVPGLPVLDMRIWGLGVVNPTNGGAPLDTPEAEVFGILVRPAPISTNLIGGPVTNNVLAHIDYTNTISNNFVYIPGADITFFGPGASGIPSPLFEAQLARFGPTTPASIDGATRGSLYSLVDFAFVNDGNTVVTGDMLTLPDTSSREAKVFFDTGTTTTQITRPMAAALGIDPDADTPDDTVQLRSAGGTLTTVPCFAIDNVEFPGMNGAYKYVITSPLVCVSDASHYALSAYPHDVILGTNYFEQTQILWNGPGDTLGFFRGVSINSPPTAAAGPDQTVECTSSSGTPVTLDGSGSSDPDGDLLTFSWTGPFGTESGSTPTISLALGSHVITLSVDDGNGATDSDDVQIDVVDTTPPIVDAGPDVVLEATSPAGAAFDVLPQIVYSDSCGAVGIAITPTPPNYPLGDTIVTVTATDGSGNQASDTMIVSVQDTTPPELSISATPAMLWPPNHRMEPIDVAVAVSDIADPDPTVALTFVQSDEGDTTDTYDPAFDTTDVIGRKGGDIQVVDDQLFLRAERAGKSDGRIYTITYTATDASGNSSTATTTVTVPHNM